MKTIAITLIIENALGPIRVVNQHVTCLGDALLKSKERHPELRLRHIVGVEIVDNDGQSSDYKFTSADLDRQQRAAQIDAMLERFMKEARDTYSPLLGVMCVECKKSEATTHFNGDLSHTVCDPCNVTLINETL